MGTGFAVSEEDRQAQQAGLAGFLAEGVAAPGGVLPNPALDITLRLTSPISSARGSPRLLYSQVLTTTTVANASLFALGIDFLVQLAAWFFGEDRVSRPTSYRGSDGTVTMPLSALSQFLKRIKNGRADIAEANPTPQPWPVETRPGVEVEPPQPMTLLLLLNGRVSPSDGSPIINLTIPVLSFPGITGGLPIIIIGLIATILVRAVVPPSTSGTTPPADPPQEPKFQFGTEEILQLLQQFGEYFTK